MQRDPHNCIIAGVCSGLGKHLLLDPLIMRLIFVALFLCFGAGPLLYILLWLLTPKSR